MRGSKSGHVQAPSKLTNSLLMALGQASQGLCSETGVEVRGEMQEVRVLRTQNLGRELFSKFWVLPSAQCYISSLRTLSIQVVGWEGRGAAGLGLDAQLYLMHSHETPPRGSLKHRWPILQR